MRLTALALTKIEGDIIEEFVRHTARFVDELFVVDNVALDSTPEILRALKDEGLPVTTWTVEFIQERADVMTELARRVFAQSADTDYLLVLDPDEFLRVSSRAKLEAALARLPKGAHGQVPWVTYVPTKSDDPQEPRTLRRICNRLRAEFRPFSKVIVSRSFMNQPDATVEHGSHGVGGSRAVVVPLRGVALSHFPVRSIPQLQSKAVLGWPSFLAANYDEQHGFGYQWRRIHERLRKNPNWSADDLFDAALKYLDDGRPGKVELVRDPLPTVECKYPCAPADWQDVAIAYTRQLARAYAELATKSARLRSEVQGLRGGKTLFLHVGAIVAGEKFDPKSALDPLLEDLRKNKRPAFTLVSEDSADFYAYPGAFERLVSGAGSCGYDTHLFLYVRPQSTYVEDLYAVLAMRGLHESFETFLETILADGRFVFDGRTYHFNYAAVADYFAERLGRDRVVVRKLRSGEVKRTPSFLAVLKELYKHAATSKARNNLDPKKLIKQVLRADEGEFLAEPFTILDMQDEKKLLARFEQSNRRLAECYGLALPQKPARGESTGASPQKRILRAAIEQWVQSGKSVATASDAIEKRSARRRQKSRGGKALSTSRHRKR